jgi:phosphatidylinositol dimannoside acyltransferase
VAGNAYLAAARLARALPSGLRQTVAATGGAAWYWLSAGQRRAALDNYAAVLGLERSDPEVAKVARRAFQNYGRTLLEFLLVGSITNEDLISRVSMVGRENVDHALTLGRGAIVAVPHMGAWDMSGAYAGATGFRVVAVADRFPGSLNDAVVTTRERYGVRVLTLGRSAIRAITQHLQANGVVALVCDLPQGPGINVHFFGRSAEVPGGPAAIALKTGAPLLTAYQYWPEPGRHIVHVDPALALAEGETKESLTQRVIDRFEEFIRGHPDQWFAFRPMFAKV